MTAAGLIDDMTVEGKPAPKEASARVKSIRAFKCPNCGGQIDIRAAGVSLTAVCAHCGSVVDVSNENLKIIQAAHAQAKATLLEIGARGKLSGVTWEVIGYTLKSDKTGIYFWDEYLLFNPYYGFRFLIQMDGHWSYAKILKEEFPKPGFNCQVWRGVHCFKPFLQDQPIVQYVKGEFYWRIKKGDRARTEDYVCPPHMLSFEYTDGDITVTQCDYIEPGDIAAAFSLTQAMPRKKGVAPNQPNPYRTGMLFLVTVVAFVIAAFIHMSTTVGSRGQLLLTIGEVHVPGDQTIEFTSPPIEIPSQTNILVKSYAPVDNQWTEIGLSLENEATGQAFDMRQPIEYYHGYDSDGAWSEGGQWQEDYFSGVPAGTYRLVYDVDSGAFQRGQPMDIQVTLRSGVAPLSNFFVTVILILFWPLSVWWRKGAFETRRWSTSDFAPSGDE